jgi:hypothetical protein
MDFKSKQNNLLHVSVDLSVDGSHVGVAFSCYSGGR